MANTTAHFTAQIPLRYLHEGTSFVAFNTITGEKILARADMDGHAVSSNYGARATPANHYYDLPERDYINVKLRVLNVEADNAGSPDYQDKGRTNAFGYGYGQAERPIGYSVGSRYGVNTSLHIKDGWVALVGPGAYETYEADLAIDQAADEESLRQRKIAEAEAALAAAQDAVVKAQAALKDLRG